MAIALVLARGMMMETVRDPFHVEIGAQAVPRGPGPATGLILDLLSCIPALLVLVRGAIDRSFVIHRSLAHALMLILGVWTMLSPLWAADKFAAAVSACHWFSALFLLWAASQLVRSWSELRIVAAAAFALLLVLTAHGIIYRLVELPELKEQVERDWATILQDRGWEADSYIAQRFKQRVMAGEMIGFSASANTFGAMIVMLSIVSAGLALQRIVHRDEFGWSTAILVALAPAAWVLWYTQSRTALATPVLAGAIFTVAWFGLDVFVRRRKLLFGTGVAISFLLVAAVIGHGLRHGTLFHDSLTFRWKYWVGAWRVFVQHTFHGVGFANFGPHYLGTRLPEAAEEINDPHNLIVRIGVELGLVGGLLLLGWMVRLWWELTRPTLPRANDDVRHRAALAPPSNESTFRLLRLAAAATIIAILAAVDFAQPWAYTTIEVLKRLLYMLLLMIGLVVGTLRSTRRQELDDRPAPMLLYAVLVAVGIFLVHNLVDFSLFETGPMFVFALLTGSVLGLRFGDTGALNRAKVLAALSIGAPVWLAAAIGVAAPVLIAEREAHRGDEELRARSPASAAEHFRAAYRTLWIPNADYASRAARAMIFAGQSPEDIRSMLRAAIEANPVSPAYPRLRAEYELRQLSPDADRVIADYARVLALDPNDVSAHLDYARVLERLGRSDDARRRYEHALHLNDLLDPAEPERLPAERIAEIQSRIERLSR